MVRGPARGRPGAAEGLRALVLAAGAGTRLRPLTDVLPKPLAPVGGRPVAARLLERIPFELALNLHHGADLIERVLGPGPEYLREEWLRGTAGALRGAAGFIGGESFMVASSDGVHEVDLTALAEHHRASGAAATVTVKRLERPETCALVELEDGLVRRFVEKPPPEEVFTDLASIGIYCFEPEVIELVPGDRPFDIAGELIPALLDAGMPVAAYETEAWWSDIGDPAELLAANLRFAEVVDSEVAADADVTGSMVGPGARIGCGARVRRALVLPGADVPAGGVVEDAIHGSGEDVLGVWLR